MGIFHKMGRRLKGIRIIPVATRAFFLLLMLLLQSPTLASAADFAITSSTNIGDVSVMQVTGTENYFSLFANGNYNAAPRNAIAQEFFKTHKDEYDFLVIFTNYDFAMPEPAAKAFYSPIRNDISGIGAPIVDYTELPGSSYYGITAQKIQGLVEMGNLAKHASDPLDPNFEDTLMVLNHEMLHRWGAYVKFKTNPDDPNSPVSEALLGRNNAHWSYLLDTNGSVLYGNHWKNNNDGTFTSIAPENHMISGNGTIYSPLDLYLMGMIDKTQVPDMLLIDNPAVDKTQLTHVGDTISGTATSVSMRHIIAAMGERVPSAAQTPKSLRVGFIYATSAGTFINADLFGINAIQKELTTRFMVLTDGKGVMEVASSPTTSLLPTNPGVIPATITPRTLPFDMNDGLAWLKSRQVADGRWEDLSLTTLRDTTEALLILKNYGMTEQGYVNGMAWLTAATAGNTDYLCRSIKTLADGGRSTSTLVDRLVSEQNSDGGWGSARNFVSNAADTALAVKALAAAGHANDSVIANAIDYLSSNQNANGGWGIGRDQISSVQPTAAALSVFKTYRSFYSLESRISSGVTWLASKQNVSDGGFGNSPSTVYDTAAALTIMSELGASSTIINDGATYLRGQQSASGSWNESVYQTAAAMNALWKADVAPDLAVYSSDIVISHATVTSIPTTVTINATIWNEGSTAVSSAVVALYDGDPVYGNKVTEQAIAVSGPGSTTVTFSATITDANDHTFFISVDPLSLITEKSRMNNIAWQSVAVHVETVTIGFGTPDSSGVESTTSLQIPVALSAPLAQPVSIMYAVNSASTATSGADYVLTNGTLNFAPGETTKNINLTVINDQLVELNETVVIDLTNPVNAVLGQSRHTYTIVDNDVAPVVGISSPVAGSTPYNTPQLLYTVTPGNATVSVKVDGVIVNKTSGSYLDPLSNAVHTVRIEASDGVNVSFAEVVFTVNFAPPVVTIRSPIESVYTGTTTLLRYYVDKPATVVVKVDGAVVNKVSGDTLDALADGGHVVRIEALDAIGVTGVKEAAFTVYNGIQRPYDLMSPIDLGSRTITGSATDKAGNTFVASYSCDTASKLMYVTKYNLQGAVVWETPQSSFHVGECPYTEEIAVDPEGSAYIAYYTWNNVGAYYQDGMLAKFDKDGLFIGYATTKKSGASDYVYSIFAGEDGYLYAGGTAGNNLATSYWIKLDKSRHTIALNEIRLGTANIPDNSAITADADGNIYIAGYTTGSLDWDTVTYPNAGGEDYYIVSYAPNGSLRWAYQGGTTASDRATGVAADDLGGVYLTGNTGGGLDGNTNLGSDDIFIIKFDTATGVRQWTRQLGTFSYDHANDITVEKNGLIYVTGISGDTFAGADGIGGVFVIKGDGSGGQFDQYWVKQFGTATGTGGDISLMNDGYVFAREGSTLYTLRDPRLPSVALDQDPMWSIGSNFAMTGTISPFSGIVEVSSDTGATGGLATYPTATTWQVVVSGLMEGKNDVTVTAENIGGFRDTIHGTIFETNSTPPVITTTSLPFGMVGTAYNQALTATGGKQPYKWSLQSGTLPHGISLVSSNTSTELSGSPLYERKYDFTVQVTDANGWVSTRDLNITVYPLFSNTSIVAYSFEGQESIGLLDETAKTVTISVPYGTNLTELVGTFLTTGVRVSVGSVDQISGTTPNNFTNPVVYTVFDADGLSSAYTVTVVIAPYDPNNIVTIAGNGTWGFNGDNIPAIEANFSGPGDVALDGAGNVYITDGMNNRIRKVSTSGIITTLTGTSTAGFFGDNGPASLALLNDPWAVAADAAGNVFFVDGENNCVRKVSVSTGMITRYAGGGTSTSDNNITATTALLGYPTSLAVDSAGNLYIADSDNARVLKVGTNGKLNRIAGTGVYGFNGDKKLATSAMLRYPAGVAVDSTGNVFIADEDSCFIWKIDASNMITIVAGDASTGRGSWEFNGDGIPATTAGFDAYNVAVDTNGNILIADYSNNRVRKVDTAGMIWTVAGNGQAGFSGDPGVATRSKLNGPSDVTVDTGGNLYIADYNNGRIRKVYPRDPVIVTASLPAGNVGVAYSQTLVASGGTAPYVWSVAPGTLPAGLTLIPATGVISGMPTTAGTTSFTIQVTDANAALTSKQLSITMSAGLTITTTSLAPGTTGAAYSQTLLANNGTGIYTWSRTAGTMPTGLSLSTAGVISGTPTSAGTTTLTFQVRDGSGATNSKTLPLSIYAPLTITRTSLASGLTGSAYSQTLSATGGLQPYVWSTSTGTLPSGLSLSPGGLISGTPVSAGTSTVTYKVTDANSKTSTKALGITITAPVSITTSTLPTGTTGTTYSKTLAATGGKTPYTWLITTGSGTLPPGLTLNGSTGVISGTPTAVGTSTFNAQVKDANNVTNTKLLSISVYSPLSITTTSLVPGLTGSAYSQTLAATGGLQPYVWSSTTGTLPSGLSISTEGLISGTPVSAGTSTVTYKVTDANSKTITKALGITISAPVSVATSTLATGFAGTTYSQTLAASGGKTPYTWSVTAGSLPVGYTLSTAGVISGTTTTIGTSNFTVQVKDANNATSTKDLSIIISTAPVGVAQLNGWANLYSAAPNNTSASNLGVGSFAVGSGSQRLLLVSVVMEIGTAANPTISATYGGTSLTQIKITANTQREIVWMGYLNDAQIGSGSKALALSYSGATGNVSALHVKWASYTGVNQTNPAVSSGAVNTASTSATFGSTINYVNKGMTIVVAGNGGTPATGTLTASPSFTAGTATTTNAQTSRIFSTAPHTAAGSYASTTKVTWSGTTNTRSGLLVVSLQP